MSFSAPSSPRSPSKMTSALVSGTSTSSHPPPPAHNVFSFDNIVFSSNFDNGNLGRVERVPNRPYEFKVWTAPDNMGTEFQSKHCAWFHFSVAGLPMGCVLRIQLVNASNHSGLYKHDMRPVYRSSSTNQKWVRIRSSVRFIKEGENAQLYFEHSVDADNDKICFAFTYPYTYTQMQTELANFDMHTNRMDVPDSIFYQRELLTSSCDGRRLDLLTITSVNGASPTEKEPLLPGLFPETLSPAHSNRPPVFPTKEVVLVSARVHPGEVPAQHTFKGVLSLLMDPDDQTARELRARYVFKLIPMLNPDGVFRGHFRMDQHGHNLNRYYNNPDPSLQPTIYAAKSLLDYYAQAGRLSMYLDMHAHASKRGCFIYGNVLDQVEDQIQNQLYCKLISMNSAHFDYEGCLFSREHMFRIDPGDQAKGLTAEGSGRVHTYLAYGLVHSYTLECNYNTSRIGNEVAPPEQELAGQNVTLASPFTTNPEKYTPSSWAGVGRACIVAMLDIRGQNPCSRIPKSKFKTLDRVRNAVVLEVRNRKEYQGKQLSRERRRSISDKKLAGTSATQSDEFVWRRVVDGYEVPTAGTRSGTASARSSSASLTVAAAAAAALEQQVRIAAATAAAEASSSNSNSSNQPSAASYLFIPAGKEKRRKTMSGAPVGKAVSSIASTDSAPTTARREHTGTTTAAAAAAAATAGVAASDSDSVTTISVASSSTNQTTQPHKATTGPTAAVAAAGRPPMPTTAGRSANQRDGDSDAAHHGDGGAVTAREKYQHLEHLILESQSARVTSHKTLSPPTATAVAPHVHSSIDGHEPLTAESFLHTSPSKMLHGPLIGNTTKTMQQYFQSLAVNPASPSQQPQHQQQHQHQQQQPQPPLASDHPGGGAARPSRPRSADALKSVNSSRRDRSNSNGNSTANGHGNVTVEVLVPPAKASPDRSTSSSHSHSHSHSNNHSDFAFLDGHFHPLASSSSPPGADSSGSSRNSKSSDSSRLGVGASIRDLMREQSIQKLIKLSTHPTMTAPATTTATTTAHSSTNGSSAASTPTVAPAAINSQPAPVPSARRGSNTTGLLGGGSAHSPGPNKDNRKILGKTLHAAGVALLMQGPPPTAAAASSAINTAAMTADHATENHPANHLLSVQGMSATSRSSSQANMHHASSSAELHIPVPIPHYSHR